MLLFDHFAAVVFAADDVDNFVFDNVVVVIVDDDAVYQDR